MPTRTWPLGLAHSIVLLVQNLLHVVHLFYFFNSAADSVDLPISGLAILLQSYTFPHNGLALRCFQIRFCFDMTLVPAWKLALDSPLGSLAMSYRVIGLFASAVIVQDRIELLNCFRFSSLMVRLAWAEVLASTDVNNAEVSWFLLVHLGSIMKPNPSFGLSSEHIGSLVVLNIENSRILGQALRVVGTSFFLRFILNAVVESLTVQHVVPRVVVVLDSNRLRWKARGALVHWAIAVSKRLTDRLVINFLELSFIGVLLLTAISIPMPCLFSIGLRSVAPDTLGSFAVIIDVLDVEIRGSGPSSLFWLASRWNNQSVVILFRKVVKQIRLILKTQLLEFVHAISEA